MFADGSNGSVELTGDSVVIRRKGLANILTQGIQGEKVISLSSITAIQFKESGNWMAGMIQFTLQGGREFRGGMLEATKDENAVLFEKKQQPAFVELRDRVRSLMAKSAPVSTSRTEELIKLAELVDRGFLTREEFEQRKSEMFGAA